MRSGRRRSHAAVAVAASPASSTSWPWPRRNMAIASTGRLVVLDEQDRGGTPCHRPRAHARRLRGRGSAARDRQVEVDGEAAQRARPSPRPVRPSPRSRPRTTARPMPGAAPRALALARDAVELLEQPRQGLGRDARRRRPRSSPDAAVRDHARPRPGSAHPGPPYLAALSRVFGEDLAHEHLVDQDGRQILGDVDGDGVAAGRDVRSGPAPARRGRPGRTPRGSAEARRPRRGSCRGGW